MKLPNHIKWIFFDVGGVLLDDSVVFEQEFIELERMILPHDPEITIAKLKAYVPTASATPGAFIDAIIRHFVSDPTIARELMKRFQKEFFDTQMYVRLSHVRPEAHRVLEQLSKHVCLGFMGNQPVETLEKLRESGILEYFHHQKMSGHYPKGLIKPNPEFFKAVLEEAGARAEESVIVDDNIERGLVPAKALGMTTVWYKLLEREVPEGAVDYTVTSLSELVE